MLDREVNSHSTAERDADKGRPVDVEEVEESHDVVRWRKALFGKRGGTHTGKVEADHAESLGEGNPLLIPHPHVSPDSMQQEHRGPKPSHLVEEPAPLDVNVAPSHRRTPCHRWLLLAHPWASRYSLPGGMRER